jgi:hypothetical protein
MGYVPGSVNSHVRSQRLLGQARAAAPALARQVVMTPRHQPSAARFLTHCMSPLFARRADFNAQVKENYDCRVNPPPKY